MIEMTDKTIGLWYMQVTEDSDWLAGASEVDDGRVEISYRFRYYRDRQTFGSEDKKNWYEGNVSGPKEKIIRVMRELMAHLREKDGNIPESACHELLMDDEGVEVLMDRLKEMPFCDSMMLSANEVKWMGLDGNARPE